MPVKRIRKAVLPVGGFGTRFLPATKAMPKELLPIIDKPLIQYAAEEAIAAGLTDLIFVTGRNKRAIEDHFDANLELEATLHRSGKSDIAEMIRNIVPAGVNCIFVRQGEALGLGDAVLRARPAVGDEPFAVLLPDDHMTGCVLPTESLVNAWKASGTSAISVQTVPQAEVSRYGIIKPEGMERNGWIRMAGIVEKPSVEAAPSRLASIGRYVFNPSIFDLLEKQTPGAGGEIQLADAIDALAREEGVDAINFDGRRYDCGSKIGYLEAIVDTALHHPEFSDRFRSLLRDRIGTITARNERAA